MILEARWFIDVYERRPDLNPTLLQLAKLDYNMVQATHQSDLKHMSRWDITAMEQLPDYMKICFLALFNSINEIGYNTLKEQGVHIIPYLQKMDEMKRGDIPKSIQCYMHETGASEKEAREHIKYLIGETWKKMNKDRGVESPCSHTFVELALNLGRTAQCMYQYGDGHAAQGVETKDRVLSLLINPVPLV
ncbi:hypothetical protein C3L33_03880, partial [Rhododendron williamsianum]